MVPVLDQRDVILIQLDTTPRVDDLIVARLPDQSHVVKRVASIRNGKLELASFNPSYAPVFVSRGARIATPPRVVGTDGLKIRLSGSPHDRDALGWGMGDLAPELSPGMMVDIAYRLERDTYQGTSRLQLRIADLRAAGTSPAPDSR